MKISRIVIGTANPAKLTEWSSYFSPYFQVRSLADYPKIPEVIESGKSFMENAVIKSTTYARALGEFVFSEDGGYEIDALGGAPGVRSKRILAHDQDGTDEQLINSVIEKLKGIPIDKRGVSLTSAVAISDPQGQIIFTDTSSSKGQVADHSSSVIIPGYPYRSIHYLPQAGKTYAELSPAEHELYNHKKPIALKIIAQFSNK